MMVGQGDDLYTSYKSVGRKNGRKKNTLIHTMCCLCGREKNVMLFFFVDKFYLSVSIKLLFFYKFSYNS
jgi:hypothetical protein